MRGHLRPAGARLGQPFNRLGAEFSGIEGHGLGLSISRLLAQAMAGSIPVHSVVGQGSCLALHLCSTPAPQAPLAPPASTAVVPTGAP